MKRYKNKYERDLLSSNFVTTPNSCKGPFTSILVYPESGECFVSGKLMSSEDIAKGDDNLYWYPRKKIKVAPRPKS